MKFVCWLLIGIVPAAHGTEWYRGNTHTHTLNSDGNSSPDAVARWYREHGYQFVVITDHEYLTDVGPLNAVVGGQDRFLIISGEEITQEISDPSHPDGMREVHINAINSNRVVHALGAPYHGGSGRLAPPGTTVAEALSRNLEEVRTAGGIAQINHPNFRWSLAFEHLTEVPDGTLFELWNGQPEINNLGGSDGAGRVAPSTEALWDRLLSRGRRLWAVASDDSHYFRALDEPNPAPPGQAWIMVRADGLEPDAIINALRRGDFYASTGITLEDYTVAPGAIAVKIRQSTRLNGWTPDARFLTRFIGEGGRVLAEVAGLEPKYVFRGNEIYVRAAITDSNGRRAWTQPVFRASGGSRP